MKTKRTRWWLKSAALLCATVFGLTAFGDYVWSGGTSADWSAGWTGESGNYVFAESADDITVSFSSAATISSSLWVENGTASTVTFTGTNADPDNGVAATGLAANQIYIGSGTRPGSLYLKGGVYQSYEDIPIAFDRGTSGSLTLENATLTCEKADGSAKWIVFGSWGQVLNSANTGSITLKSGAVLRTYHIQSYLGGASTINFEGGKLAFLGDSTLGNYRQFGEGSVYGADGTTAQPAEQTVVVGEAGGTIETGGHTITVTAPVTGTGTLTVIGGGTATFTSTPGCVVVAGDEKTTVVLPEARAAVVDLDFKDASTYTSGWTLGGNGGYSQGERTLADGSTSKFLRVWTGTGSGDRQYTASYTLPSDFTAAGEYTLEFDWFAPQNATYGNTSLDMGLYVYAGSDVKLKIISNPVTLSGNKAQIYLNGSETPLETKIDTAPAKNYSTDPSQDCTGTTNQDKWYHIVFRANATDGLMLKILNYQGTEVLAETKVSDFANISRIYLDMNKRRSNFEAFGGLDDVVGTVPAVATINGTGYATLAAAGAAAKEGDTIILADNINLESSATIAWGAKVAFAGHSLVSSTEGVEVLFDDGVHKLASTTEDGTTTFTEEIVTTAGSFIWTGESTPDEHGFYVWSDTDNWQGGVAPTLATDNVYIGAGDAVTITGSSAMTGVLYIDRDVTITGTWTLATVNGTGTLKMDGVTLSNAGDFTVNCDLDTANSVYVASGSLTLNGALKGTGTITHYSSSSGSPSGGFQFHGDTSAFAGSYTGCTRANNSRDRTKFYSPAFGSANAYWQFGFEGSSGSDKSHAFQSSGEYHFGTLDSKALKVLDKTGVTLVIGERAGTSTLTVEGGLRNATNKIVKKNPAEGSSTLDLTLTAASDGTIEAEAGVLNMNGSYAPTSLTITGTNATVVVASTCGTTTTETVVVTEAVEDNPSTEEDETQAEVTKEVTTFTALKPVLSADLTAAYYQLKSVAGESATTYTVADVVQDADGNTYKTIAAALAAIADAENKTLTLIFDTTEPVVLPAVGYALNTNGHAIGTVSGATGVGVTVAGGVYTSVDNTSATWKGDAAGANWAEAANWSTGAIPDEGTAVSFTYNALVYISDHDNLAHKCASITIDDGVTVEFAPTNKDYTIYPRVAVYGDITGGKGTLKLWRSGIIEQADGYVAVYPAVQFENPGFYEGQTRDSWFQGNFTFHGDVTGTGVLVLYDACTFDTADINVPEGSVVDFRANPTLSHASETLTGTGTVIVHYVPQNGSRWKAALQNSTNWQGVTEVQGTIDSIDAANFGGTGSTVRFNGVSGYLRAGEGVEVGNVKTIEIGANGLTLNNQYTSGAVKNYLIKADLTGTGAIKFGTKHQLSDKSKYVFTGDVSGFTGAINYGDLGSYRACVYFADSSITTSDFGSLTVPTDWGQIIVEEGKTVNVAATWYGAGGWLINGTVNVASTGSLTCDSNGAKVGGTGTINYAALPTSAPTWNTTAWTGTVVLPKKTGSLEVPLAALGVTGSKIVVNGFSGSTTGNSVKLVGTAIDALVELAGDVRLQNANDGETYTFAEVTGSGNFAATLTGTPTTTVTMKPVYAFTKLTDYKGTLSTVTYTDKEWNTSITIGTVALSEVVPGEPAVKLAADANLTTDPAEIAVEVAGEETEAALFKAADGNLYVAVASVTVTPAEGDPVTTPFATYEAAAAFADENSVTEFAVLYGDGVMNGWDYDSEAGTLTKNAAAIARVGTTNYNSLEAAFAAAGEDDTVVLFGTSAENVTVGEGQTLVVEGTYTGALSGFGTVDAKVVTTPAGFSSWTGTFVLDWDTSAATDSTAWELNNYGVSGSTVVIARPITKGYIKAPVSGSKLHNVAPAVYLKANVLITNGFATNPDAENPVDQTTTFSQLGADEGVTLSFRYLASAQVKDTTLYAITKLKDFAGSFVLNAYNQVTVESVELAATPAFGTKIVSATVADTASLTGKIAEGYPLVVKDDGLYFDPVAQVGTAYYNTLADAVTAANGATVVLVKSTDEGVVVAGGQTVVIQFGDYSTGEISAADGCTLATDWDEATKTGTYTASAQETEGVEPGETAEYDTEAEATAATMAVPEAVAAAVTGVALDQYKGYFEKVVTAPTTEGGKYTVEYVLNDTITGLIETEFAAKLATVDVGSLATAEEATAVTITAAPGLYYGVQSQTSLASGAPVKTESSVLATSDTVTVTFPAADDSAQKFFTIFASPTDPAASSAGDDAQVGNEAGSGQGA